LADEYFRHPWNGYVEKATTSYTWLWALLFGPFYFAHKGAWRVFVIAMFLDTITAGLLWLVYPFFAKRLIIKNYRQSGWVELHPPSGRQR
jgi:hypothetical protein